MILKRTKKVVIRAMCGVKSIEKRNSKELTDLEDTLNQWFPTWGSQSILKGVTKLLLMQQQK